MPPSGYNDAQSESIATFLESIAGSLKAEGQLKGFTPVQALDAECCNIRIILDEKNGALFADQVLQLTATFYQYLRKDEPKSYEDFDGSVRSALRVVEAQIMAVHVPEIMNV